ncbi:hypothetical protein B0H10DRAFT_826924 [Mycena sp. CBHHK59/15]|nr:hypothetical protein B0H10DRAFT_826924 [Mycena sp. CBHHK59/15]
MSKGNSFSLVHYNILAESPYILPIQGFVRDPNGDLEGLLLPYLGAEAVLWHEDKWNCAQKEILSAALMDAVWDIVRQGVELTDVKGDNVLLGSDGIKLIDLDTRATTGARGSTKGNLTVRRLGCTLSAVWNERHYPDYFVPLAHRSILQTLLWNAQRNGQ